MTDRFAKSMSDAHVAKDVRVLADFVRIYCDGHHRGLERRPAQTDAALMGVYGRKVPTLCAECEEHLVYAEKRRAYCPKDPKPFCAHCDTHCYKPDERDWQRAMMRYSGPRSWMHGHLLDTVRHAREGMRYQRSTQAAASADARSNREESR